MSNTSDTYSNAMSAHIDDVEAFWSAWEWFDNGACRFLRPSADQAEAVNREVNGGASVITSTPFVVGLVYVDSYASPVPMRFAGVNDSGNAVMDIGVRPSAFNAEDANRIRDHFAPVAAKAGMEVRIYANEALPIRNRQGAELEALSKGLLASAS